MTNKTSIIIVIVLLLLLVIGLTTGLAFLIYKNYDLSIFFNFNNSNTELIDSIESEPDSINTIKINVISTDIEIKESTSNIKLEYYSNSDKNPELIIEDNKIILDENKFDLACIGFCNVNRKAILYIPSNYEGNFNIETVSGDIKSGINLTGDLNIKTTSGDISLQEVNNLDIKTTSGDIEIKTINNRISLDTTSGDVDIVKIKIKENSSIKTISGDVEITDNTSNCYIETSSTSGDIKVNKSDRKSDIELKIKTTSGDIEVN